MHIGSSRFPPNKYERARSVIAFDGVVRHGCWLIKINIKRVSYFVQRRELDAIAHLQAFRHPTKLYHRAAWLFRTHRVSMWRAHKEAPSLVVLEGKFILWKYWHTKAHVRMQEDGGKHLLIEHQLHGRQSSLLQSEFNIHSQIEHNCKLSPRAKHIRVRFALVAWEIHIHSKNFNAVQPCRLIYCDRKQGRNFIFPQNRRAPARPKGEKKNNFRFR